MVTCKITKPNKRVKHYLIYLDQSLTGPLYHNELKELELKIPEDGQSICMDIDEKMADLILKGSVPMPIARPFPCLPRPNILSRKFDINSSFEIIPRK